MSCEELFAHRPVGFEGFFGFRAKWNNALLVAFAADTNDAVFAVHVNEIEAGEFADTQASGVEQLKNRAVALDEDSFFVGVTARHLALFFARAILSRILFHGSRRLHATELVQETVHFFRGENGGNALGQLGSWNEARRVLLHEFFANAVFEERSQ